MTAQIAPSILAADFANLAADVARVAADADLLHVDCMDGHYVPNLSIGPPVVVPVVGDATRPPLRAGAFDRVLVDAPCSGLGVLHRRPDARWRVRPDDVTTLAALSKELLAAAAPLVKPDGLLVFSVCTITAAETAVVAGWAAHELPGFTPLPSPGGPWHAHGHGALLLPQVAGTDGMFIARFHRS